MNYILIAALAPVAMLLYYIYRKDDFQKEPVKEVLKAFGLGVVSVFVSLMISGPLGAMGFYPDEPQGLWGAVAVSFFGAAIPEEIAKFLLFWLFVRHNKYFDEHMDGIVYASVVSLGFAGVENILYLFSAGDEWLSTGISRAIFSVPGHFFFGILMGYYYSLVRFDPLSPSINKFWVLGAPIIAHGIFDTILFAAGVVNEFLALVLMVLFVVFCNSLRKLASRSIREHLVKDGVVVE
ncbi:MAG: PrsW family intramembrane metalloprotease [Bacteroidales bacterium]|nr:PrsW family intramembrane metalloprotease [Bacteroidales bacterium]